MLYTILATLSLTLEVLKTTFCLDEHTLIIRPLTPVSAEPSHLRATTNHFLLGKQSTETSSDVGVKSSIIVSGTLALRLTPMPIWALCLEEVVPDLNRISKWQTPAEKHLKIGYFGWIVKEITPRV